MTTREHLPTRRQPLESLVASAKRISGRRVRRTGPKRWQDEAWDMYDLVGELRYVANTQASAMSRASIFAATIEPGADDPAPVGDRPEEEQTDDDRLAADTVAAIGGSLLGRGEIIRRLALQLFVPGDGWLVGLPAGILDDEGPRDAGPPEPGEIGPEDGAPAITDLSWHAFSVQEVSVDADRVRLNLGDQQPRELPASQVYTVRVWRPHPKRWWEADSPVRANLPVLRELVGLTKHVSATIDSRLAGAGLLLITARVEVEGVALDEGPPGDGEQAEGGSPVVAALVESMVTPLEDRDSAAALVPLVLKVTDDVEDVSKAVHWISFATPFDEHARELRDEAIRRLALGLDAPPETLLGLGSTNHWSAWQIEESTVKIHLDPALQLLCDALTSEYLWPVLKAAGVADWRRYVVWFDTTTLSLRPNRAQDAKDLHERSELSGRALRRETGFDEADAPPRTDRAVEIALAMLAGQPGLAETVGIAQLVETLRATIAEGEQIARAIEDGEAPPAAEGTGMDLPDTMDDPAGDDLAASGNGRPRQPVARRG